MSAEITLQDAFKADTLDQDKVILPEATVRRFKEKAAALDLKILNKTERIDNGRLDIPVFFSECGVDAREVIGTNKQMGKGADPAQSEASAVMELAERFSFFSFYNNPDNFFTDTFKNVEKDALDFSLILQSVQDDSLDEKVARQVFEDLPLKWTRGFNLTREKEVLLPFNWFYMLNEFNGPSAGNCVEEALCQGISEIVERHVSSLVSHGRLRVPAIDPDSATDPVVREMIAKYRRAGINLYISDFTLGMGIPTVAVMAHDPATFPVLSELVWTAGTAPDPQKALARALTEVAQLGGDFNTGSNYVASGLPKYADLGAAGYIVKPEKTISIQDLPNLSHVNIRVEVERAVAALARKGMDILTINTMHPGLKLPAFYTIMPGGHFRERAVEAGVGLFAARLITESYEPGKAIQKLADLERLIPDAYYIRFYTGLSHLNLGEAESALEHLEQAMALEPARLNIPDISSYMGVALKELGRYTQALEILEQGEAIDDQRTDIHNLKGFCHFMMKNHEAAITSFKRVVEIDPSSAIDYANIASNYRDLGEREQAVDYYERALAIDPTIDFARDNLARLKKA